MKKLLLTSALAIAALVIPASASTITLTSSENPTGIGSFFDVFVDASNIFDAPQNNLGDALIGFGFNVSVGDAGVINYLGATVGNQFIDVSFAPGQVLGIASDLDGVLTSSVNLAVLHFQALSIGTSSIAVQGDADPFDNLGLLFVNNPGSEAIAATTDQMVAPEPSTFVLGGILTAGLLFWQRRRVRV